MKHLLAAFLILISAPSALGETLACEGEDPFWHLDLRVDAGSARFERTGETAMSADIALTALAQGDRSVRAFSLTNMTTGFTGIAVTAPAACVLGGDESFSHRVEFLTQALNEAILLTGCCRASR